MIGRIEGSILLLLATGPASTLTDHTNADVVLGDYQAYTDGAYLAFIAPFNAELLKEGTDYRETITIAKDKFPNASVMKCSWPTVQAPKGVYGFIAIDYGFYDDTSVQQSIPPRRVDQIKTLRQNLSISLHGDPQGYDVITDMFLTSRPKESSTRVLEVEVFHHTPDASAYWILKQSKQVGVYNGSGLSWTVALNDKDVLFMPTSQSDVLRARLRRIPLSGLA